MLEELKILKGVFEGYKGFYLEKCLSTKEMYKKHFDALYDFDIETDLKPYLEQKGMEDIFDLNLKDWLYYFNQYKDSSQVIEYLDHLGKLMTGEIVVKDTKFATINGEDSREWSKDLYYAFTRGGLASKMLLDFLYLHLGDQGTNKDYKEFNGFPRRALYASYESLKKDEDYFSKDDEAYKKRNKDFKYLIPEEFIEESEFPIEYWMILVELYLKDSYYSLRRRQEAIEEKIRNRK